MRKKYAVIIALVAVLLIAGAAVFIAARDEAEPELTLQQVLKEKYHAYETDLSDSLVSMETNTDVGNYLLAWAKNKQITAVSDSNGNIYYNIPAAETAREDAQPAAVICSFDASNMEMYIEEISTAMTIARNVTNNGPLQIIFLAEDESTLSGAETLDASRFGENTAVFCLGRTTSSRVSTVTGGYQHIRISDKIHRTEPTYTKAYKIVLKNCPSVPITGKYSPGLNPIKTLGSVLANFKSTSLLFELSSFSGGSDELITPSRASMTIVINESDAAKFEKKMTNFIAKYNEKYLEEYPEIEYTFEETDLPSTVIKREDTDNLVSLMYTAFNGVYNRNEEGTMTALTNIGRISTKDGRLKIDTAVMCSDEAMMAEISETYETICGLSDVKFNVKENIPIYSGDGQESTVQLLETFREAFIEYTEDDNMVQEDTAVLTACSWIHEKNPDLPMIFCGLTSKSSLKFAGSIITWLDQSAEETEE